MLGSKLRAPKREKDLKIKYKMKENIVNCSKYLAPLVTASLLIVFIVKILSEPKIYFSKKSVNLITSNTLNVFNSIKNQTEHIVHLLNLSDLDIAVDYSGYTDIYKKYIESIDFSGIFVTFDLIFNKTIPILSILGFSLHFMLATFIPKYSIRNILSLSIWFILSWFAILGDRHLYLIQVC